MRDSRPVESVPDYNDGTNVLVRFFRVAGQSEKAYKLWLTHEDVDGVWMPKSQIAHIDRDKGEMWIPMWLAEKKGLDFE